MPFVYIAKAVPFFLMLFTNSMVSNCIQINANILNILFRTEKVMKQAKASSFYLKIKHLSSQICPSIFPEMQFITSSALIFVLAMGNNFPTSKLYRV